MLRDFLQDIRLGVRGLTKNLGFSSVAVLSLAFGLSATTAIYSVVHAVVLDPFPYKDVDSLTSVKVSAQGQRGFRTQYSTDEFLELAERNSIFEGVIASTISDVLWTSAGEPQRVRGNYGTPNTFQVMGVPPLVGRTFAPDDGKPDAAAVVVLGFRFWQRQFAGDRSVLGRELVLNGTARTVIGVMPKRFMWRGADVYLPIVFARGRVVEGVHSVHLLGRLKPDVTEARAEADLRPIIEVLKQREPSQFPDKWRVGLLSFKETFPSSIRQDLWILLGAVGLLLLIACFNVSNLLLSRATFRQKEMAVRAAIGANRARLIRQLLTESVLLAVLAAAIGTALAFGSLRAILALVPSNTIPDESEVAINIPVLLFTLGISVLTAIIFGLAPALHSCTSNLWTPLRESGRGLAGSSRQIFLRNGLVVAEVALSLMLLVSATLMIRTLQALHGVRLGFHPERILTMRIPLADQRYPDTQRRVAFLQDLLGRCTAVPGVLAAGLNTGFHPFGNMLAPVDVVGSTAQNTQPALVHQISADYIRVMGVSLLQGRFLTEREVIGKQRLALVNRSFVTRKLEDRSPLGAIVRIPRLRTLSPQLDDDSFQIVGVVQDTLNQGLSEAVIPEIYLPYTLTGVADRLAILTQADAASVVNTVRAQVYAIDRNQPVTNVRTIEDLLRDWEYSGPRFNLTLFSVFAFLGLALAVFGIYGLMSNSVAQQTREIGVRMALGADPGCIAGMVVRRGSWLLLAGIALGTAGSMAATRVLANQVWDVSPVDPISIGGMSLLLLLAGLLACYWPARRASRVDPLTALRQE